MRTLSKTEFRALATKQGFTRPETLTGFIDKDTHEVVLPLGTRTRVKTHEVGHKIFNHFPKAVEFYGKGKKDVYNMWEPWTQMIDDEIEAEKYSYEVMGKKLTPRIGLMALRELLHQGWKFYPALSLTIGQLKRFGINTSLKERRDLISVIERAWGSKVSWTL